MGSAQQPFREWLRIADQDFLTNSRADVVLLLQESLALIGPARLLAFMKEEKLVDAWEPWIQALENVGGSDKALTDEASAIRAELAAQKSTATV